MKPSADGLLARSHTHSPNSYLLDASCVPGLHSTCQAKNGNRAYLQGQTRSPSPENAGQTNNRKMTSEA